MSAVSYIGSAFDEVADDTELESQFLVGRQRLEHEPHRLVDGESLHKRLNQNPERHASQQSVMLFRRHARLQLLEPVLDQCQMHRNAVRASDGDAQAQRAASLLQVENRRRTVVSKIDRGYEDFVSDRISEAFWTRKSAEWEAELQTIDAERPP